MLAIKWGCVDYRGQNVQEIVQWGTVNEFLDPDGLDDHLDDSIASDPAALEHSASFDEAPEQIQRGIWSRLKHASHATVLGAVALFGVADDVYAERNVAGAKQESRENTIDTIAGQPFGIAEDGVVESLHMDWEGRMAYFIVERKPNVTKFTPPGMYYDPVNERYIHLFIAKKTPRGAPVKFMREVIMGEQFKPDEDEEMETYVDKKSGVTITRPPLKYVNNVDRESDESINAKVKKLIPEVKADVSPAAVEMAQIEESLKKEGCLFPNNPITNPEENPTEASIHGRSIVKPSGFIEVPASVLLVVKGAPGARKIDEKKFGGPSGVLLPCPRDYFDQEALGNFIKITDQDGNEFPLDAEIVYEQASHGKGFINPFVMINLGKSTTDQILTIEMISWVSVPQYPDVAPQNIFFNGTEEFSNAANNALQTAKSIPYIPVVSDCGVKAEKARQVGGKKGDEWRVEVAEGWSMRKDDAGPGQSRHALNFVRDPKGSYMFDGRSNDFWYAGPQKDMIITAVGQPYENIERWPQAEKFANGGATIRVRKIGKLEISMPGIGLRGKELEELQKNPPKLIKDRAALKQKARLKQYEQPNIALGQN